MKRRFLLQLLFSTLILSSLNACNAGYYLQAARGHFDILNKREPIEALLEQADLPPRKKQELTRIIQIRNFASTQLALPENRSYRSFVELGSPYPLWNVVAASEFSLTAKTWCFPVAGCVNYRGYFSRDEAVAFSKKLQEEGYDTLVSGVPAYSTLSWFDDPALSSFSYWPASDVARLIFHELAHQKLYLSGDSDFSEAFATSVELAGAKHWLTSNGTAEERTHFETQLQREAAFFDWTDALHQKLEVLYTSDLPPGQMRAAKQEIFAEARSSYLELKKTWNGYSGFDHWTANLNNARLVSLQTYRRLLPAFEQLLASTRGDLPTYYRRCLELSRKDPEAREEELAQLTSTANLAGNEGR